MFIFEVGCIPVDFFKALNFMNDQADVVRDMRDLRHCTPDFLESVGIQAALVDRSICPQPETNPIRCFVISSRKSKIVWRNALFQGCLPDSLGQPPRNDPQGCFDSHVHTPSRGSSRALSCSSRSAAFKVLLGRYRIWFRRSLANIARMSQFWRIPSLAGSARVPSNPVNMISSSSS